MAENLTSLTARVSEERRLEECPFCLDRQPDFWKSEETCLIYACCGKWCCKQCLVDCWQRAGPESASQCPLCRTPLPEGDEEKFARLFPIAKQGKPWAQYMIGKCCWYGEGVRADPTKAVKWYQQAAEKGWFEASYTLGKMYRHGNTVEKSLEEARRFYEIAAASKDAHPMSDLSELCTSPSEQERRLELLRLSAEQGYPPAQYNLGVEIFNGEGADRSVKDAFSWFLKAADQGDNDAQFMVSGILCNVCNTKGVLGVPKALYWLRKASVGIDAEVANEAKELQNKLETSVQNHFARCNKERTDNESLHVCVRCRGIYYCGRECQMADWTKARHKKDCIPKDIDNLSPDDRQNIFTSYCFP